MGPAEHSVVATAFRASVATELLGRQPLPAVTGTAPKTAAPPLRRRVSRWLFHALRPRVRPLVSRWRAYLLAPMTAEIAGLRHELSTGRLSSGPGSLATVDRILSLERESTSAELHIVWAVDGRDAPHLAAATEMVRPGSTMTATTDLRGLAAIGVPLARWSRGVGHGARVTLTIELVEPES